MASPTENNDASQSFNKNLSAKLAASLLVLI